MLKKAFLLKIGAEKNEIRSLWVSFLKEDRREHA
jgi:hypothetical protein